MTAVYPSDYGSSMADPGEDDLLLRKYHDWCSARLAERFLQLTPEEIFALAEEAEAVRGDLPDAGSDGSSPAGETDRARPSIRGTPSGGSSYRGLIQRVTGALAKRVGLPTYEQWLAAYGEDPERFEGELWDGSDTGPGR
jgi:hypothetical protein